MNTVKPTPAFLRRLLDGSANTKTKGGKTYAVYDRIAITRNEDQCSVVFFAGKDAVATVGPLNVHSTATLTLTRLKGRFPLTTV